MYISFCNYQSEIVTPIRLRHFSGSGNLTGNWQVLRIPIAALNATNFYGIKILSISDTPITYNFSINNVQLLSFKISEEKKGFQFHPFT